MEANNIHVTVEINGLDKYVTQFSSLIEKLLQPQQLLVPPKIQQPDLELTPTQAAKLLGVSKPTLRKYTEAGIVKKTGSGKQTRYSQLEISEYKIQKSSPLKS